MTIRIGIAATASAAILVGLAAAVSSLLAALAHPLSAVAVERMGDLFATVPFLLLGVLGLALCVDETPPRARRALAMGWAVLLAGLCLGGPLVGPYAWLFEHATGRPAAAFQAAWTGVPAWTGPAGIAIDLGLARWPILAGALATAGAIVARWALVTRLTERVAASRHRLHVPRWHAPRSVTP
jgi:hypothetical protein